MQVCCWSLSRLWFSKGTFKQNYPLRLYSSTQMLLLPKSRNKYTALSTLKLALLLFPLSTKATSVRAESGLIAVSQSVPVILSYCIWNSDEKEFCICFYCIYWVKKHQSVVCGSYKLKQSHTATSWTEKNLPCLSLELNLFAIVQNILEAKTP